MLLLNKTAERRKSVIQNAEPMKKKMVRLVLPIAFQQFMLALVSACDAVMLGRLSQNAMSAVSLASQVTFVLNLFMTAFVLGENMFVAQYYGKKDYVGITHVFGLVLSISSMTAGLFLLGTLLFPEGIMRFLTNAPDLIRLGSEYLKYIGISYLLSTVSQVYLTLMKNCDAVNLSTVISSVTVILNIVLNAMFIFGMLGAPALGIQGAALATVLATAVQSVWCIVYATVKMNWLDIHLPTQNRILLKKFREKVTPVLLNELVWGGGFTMYSVIMGHLGADAVAANSIANISKNLVVCLCLGLGGAGSIMIGNELGAERFEEAKKTGKMLTKLSILCGCLSGLCLLALSPVILKLVRLTLTAKEYLRGMLLICSYYLVGKSVNSMTVGGIFPTGGDSKFGLICDTVTLWCITIPMGCICAFVLKIPILAVYFVLNLDEILKLPAVYLHYRKYGWVKNIT